MTPPTTTFPLFFTLEKVNKGYILTAKEDNGGLKEATYQKEVVTENEIEVRIGKLLKLSALTPNQVAVFHVEAVGADVYQIDNELPTNELTEAKLAYVHFNGNKVNGQSVIALQIKDTDTLEVWGEDASKAAKNNNIPLTRVGGIPVLVFPNTKDGRNALSACFNHIDLNPTSHEKLLQWYKSRKVLMQKVKPAAEVSNKKEGAK